MWQTNLAQLEKQYRITDPVLLVKSASVLAVVILLFFLASVIPGIELKLGGWAELPNEVGGASMGRVYGWVQFQ